MQTQSFEIPTERFLLRPLTVLDVTERYLSWLREPGARQYITAASQTRELDDLKHYVASRCGRDDILFLGIFEMQGGLHIGNIKYEPVSRETGHAVMGIMIGDPEYRGRHVAGEVIDASVAWLAAHRGIREIVLGVSESNTAAIRAYEKVGFAIASTPHLPPALQGALTMVRHL
jgi:RimJ/RimL family protein N-acetyltransferase